MSVGSKSLPARRVARGDEGGENRGFVEREEGGLPRGGGGSGSGKRKQKAAAARYDRCFSGLDLSRSIGSGPLKDVDAGKLKDQIRRWAKAVVAFARQISFGSPRSAVATTSPSGGGEGDTPRSATFPAASSRSSRLGGTKDEPPTDDVRA